MCINTRIFFFNDTATTEIYTLSLHDALPICSCANTEAANALGILSQRRGISRKTSCNGSLRERSEEHTSELQSQSNLVCRLLLEKKKNPHGAACASIRGYPGSRPATR